MANVDDVMDVVLEKMEGAIDHLKKDFSGIRTGKASPNLVENIMVNYYGTKSRLKDIASVTAPEPRLLSIQPWDQNAVKEIEKAILTSDIGISPVSDGRIIRLPIPDLTEERRKSMVKLVSVRAEEGKIEVRNARREANDSIKKAQKSSDITEDDMKEMLDDVQKMTDDYVKKVEAEQASKEKDLMSI